MGLLRLLTNPSVMRADTLSLSRAWRMFDAFMTDSRISRVEEPEGLERHWRASAIQQVDGSSWWTDTYLAAFAASAGFILVTFDKQLASRKNVRTLLLK